MQMKMWHFLAPVITAVQNQSIAIFGDTLGTGDIPGHANQAPNQFQVLIPDIVHGRYRMHRDNEDMHRRRRIDIPERDDFLLPAQVITSGRYLYNRCPDPKPAQVA
jgi:hypothetical protein